MKINGLRWIMIGLIFLATVINYIDRQTVSVLKTSISQDLGLSNSDYAALQNSFLAFYGISQMVSGRLYDVIGTRLGFVFSIVVWSLAALAHATARTATAFGVYRAALGFGEAGNWPGAAKVVGEWFPGPRARARHGDLQYRSGRGRRAVAAVDRLAGDGVRLAHDVRAHRRVGLRLARVVAPAVPDARPPPVDHRRRTRAHPGSIDSPDRPQPSGATGLAAVADLSADMGGGDGPLHHRSDLVALRVLAAVVPAGSTRVQPSAGGPVGVAAISLPAASVRSRAAMPRARSSPAAGRWIGRARS